MRRPSGTHRPSRAGCRAGPAPTSRTGLPSAAGRRSAGSTHRSNPGALRLRRRRCVSCSAPIRRRTASSSTTLHRVPAISRRSGARRSWPAAVMTPSMVTGTPVGGTQQHRRGVLADDRVAGTRGAAGQHFHVAEQCAHDVDLVDQRFGDQHVLFARQERLAGQRMDEAVLGARQHVRSPQRDAHLRDGSEAPGLQATRRYGGSRRGNASSR